MIKKNLIITAIVAIIVLLVVGAYFLGKKSVAPSLNDGIVAGPPNHDTGAVASPPGYGPESVRAIREASEGL